LVSGYRRCRWSSRSIPSSAPVFGRASWRASNARASGATASTPEADAPARRRLSDLLPSGRTRSAIIATVAAGSFGAFGISAASGDAIPGDTLYGVKRSAEEAQRALTGNPISLGPAQPGVRQEAPDRGRRARAATRPGWTPVLDDMDRDMREGSKLLTTAAVERGEPGRPAGDPAVRRRPAADQSRTW
jgi:hypothetical protein